MGALELLLLASLPLVLMVGLFDHDTGRSDEGGGGAPDSPPPEADPGLHGSAATGSPGSNLLALLETDDPAAPPGSAVPDTPVSATPVPDTPTPGAADPDPDPDPVGEGPALPPPSVPPASSAPGHVPDEPPADDLTLPTPGSATAGGVGHPPDTAASGMPGVGPAPPTQPVTAPAGPGDPGAADGLLATEAVPLDSRFPDTAPAARGAGSEGSTASDATETGQTVADRTSPLPSPEFDRFAARDPILGSAGSDTIAGPDAASVIFANGLDARATAGNLIAGGQGDDTLLGGAGSDTLRGGAGNNLIHASYSPELETAQGSDLFAWRDNGLPDILEGGPGDDRLVFARGDIATGGGGANVFEIWHDPTSAQPVAIVTDFDPGTDRLDVVVRIDEATHPDCGAWAWDAGVQAAAFETARVEVTTEPDTGRTEVLVEGEVVARLLGAPPLDPATLRVFAFWDIRT